MTSQNGPQWDKYDEYYDLKVRSLTNNKNTAFMEVTNLENWSSFWKEVFMNKKWLGELSAPSFQTQLSRESAYLSLSACSPSAWPALLLSLK